MKPTRNHLRFHAAPRKITSNPSIASSLETTYTATRFSRETRWIEFLGVGFGFGLRQTIINSTIFSFCCVQEPRGARDQSYPFTPLSTPPRCAVRPTSKTADASIGRRYLGKG